MSNLKTPLLSLEAHGSLGKAVSFTKRRGQNIAEKKPALPYFLTLPVQYQRWLYQDYAHLWTLQSAATKQQYQSDGVRHHLTGFQYWMKVCLTDLPWITAYWRFDQLHNTKYLDYSSNARHLTPFGLTPAAGVIAGCIHSDGLNDYATSTLTIPDAVGSIECFITPHDLTLALQHIFGQSHGILPASNLSLTLRGNKIYIEFVGAKSRIEKVLLADTTYHVLFTYDGTTLRGYLNGTEQTISVPAWSFWFNSCVTPDNITASCLNDQPGRRLWYHGLTDHLIIYSRVLDSAAAANHAARRYSL